jgi:hypothetical protein
MKWIAAGVLLLVPVAAAAEEPTICAARPGKSTPPCTVPASHLQIETGFADWTLQKVASERDVSWAVGETTIKYGLSDRSDIEVDITPWQRASSRGTGVHQSASGFGDIVIGYKHRLTAEDAALQLGALPFVKIPTAKRSVGKRRWEAGLLIPIGFAIPKSPLSIGLTPEIDWVADGDGHGHHAAMAQVASLGLAASDKLSVSGELWGQWDWDPDGMTRQYSADGSVAYLLTNNVQLDAGANFGLNRSTPDVELYAGASILF